MATYLTLTQTRYAVRRRIQLLDQDETLLDGLLIELFTDGCRISNIDTTGLREHRGVTLRIEGIGDFPGQVHCAYDGIVRLRFARPLAPQQLRSLTENSRRRPSTFEPTFFFASPA